VNNARRTSNGRTKGARPMDNRRRRPGSGQGEPPRVAEWVGLAAADSTRNTDCVWQGVRPKKGPPTDAC
jgi:hypothetical protein